jgi:flagellar hook-length control protein FliK
VNGAALPASGTGNLLPGVIPASAPADLRKPGTPGDDSQLADFASLLALVSGASVAPPAPATAPSIAAAPTADASAPVSTFEFAEPLQRKTLLLPGGKLSPLPGNSLPPGAQLATARHNNDQAATLVAPAESSSAFSGVTPRGLPDALAPFGATATLAAALPARWTHALLAAEREKTSGDVPVTEANDSVFAGDALLATPNGTRGAPLPTTLALPANPAQQPAFEQALGDRLAWLVQEGRHDARIKLHPAELGSIDIRLSLDGDSTRISLASPHAAVRDALEQAVPKLRELLESAGLDLSQVNVGSGDARSHGDFGRPTSASPPSRAHFARAEDADASVRTLAIALPQGLVDTFA